MTNNLIAPSITDDSITDKKLNNFLIPSTEAVEQFKNRLILEILYCLPNFEPLSLKSHIEQPRNINLANIDTL